MKDKQTLEQEKSHALLSAKDLMDLAKKENRVLSVEEQSRYDDFMKEVKNTDAQIKLLNEHEARQKQIDEAMAEHNQPQNRISDPPQPNAEPTAPMIVLPKSAVRYGKLKAFKSDRDAFVSGQWAAAVLFNNYAAKRWLAENLSRDWLNTMTESVGSAGGHLVPIEFGQSIIDLREEYGVFRKHCRIQPMAGEVWECPRYATKMSATFTPEATAQSATQGAFDKIRLQLKKMYGLTSWSSELNEDATIAMAEFLAMDLAKAFALLEDQCGFIGDGTDDYAGITGIMKKFENNPTFVGAVAAPGSANSVDTIGEINSASIQLLMSKLPEYAGANPKFYCSKTTKELVFGTLLAAAGGNTIQTLQGGYASSYLGAEIVTSQVLPSNTSTDYSAKPMLLYGDLGLAAIMGEGRGFRVETSQHVGFTSDVIYMRACSRVDINVHSIGDATNAGPIVALMGN